LLCGKIIVPKSRDAKTGSNLAESSKEVFGSKKGVLPMMMNHGLSKKDEHLRNNRKIFLLFKEIIAVYCENHMEYTTTLYVQKAEILYVRIQFVPHRKHITSQLQK
jgi:hypothetical protein